MKTDVGRTENQLCLTARLLNKRVKKRSCASKVERPWLAMPPNSDIGWGAR